MALHTFSKSPQHSELLEACLRAIAAGDALLLLQDGVYAAVENGHNTRVFADLGSEITLFVMNEDLLARGMTAQLLPNVKAVDYAGFVELTCLHSKTISWY